MPDNAIVANLKQQAANNSYILKAYYVDEPFTCKDCGSSEVWTAKQQQWWFEVAAKKAGLPGLVEIGRVVRELFFRNYVF